MTYLKHCEPWGDNHTNYRVVGKTPDDNSKSKVIIIKVLTNLLVLIIGYRRVWCKEAYSIKYLEKSLWHGHWQVRSAIDNLSLLLPGSFFLDRGYWCQTIYTSQWKERGNHSCIYPLESMLWLSLTWDSKLWKGMIVHASLQGTWQWW